MPVSLNHRLSTNMKIILVQLHDTFHGNKQAFVSFSTQNVESSLTACLENWDIEYTQKELNHIFKHGEGYAGGGNKSDVKVVLTEIEPDEAFDLI